LKGKNRWTFEAIFGEQKIPEMFVKVSGLTKDFHLSGTLVAEQDKPQTKNNLYTTYYLGDNDEEENTNFFQTISKLWDWSSPSIKNASANMGYGFLKRFNGVHEILETWKLNSLSLLAINFGDLSWDNDDAAELELQWQYLIAELVEPT
jgi:hypothetical protein